MEEEKVIDEDVLSVACALVCSGCAKLSDADYDVKEACSDCSVYPEIEACIEKAKEIMRLAGVDTLKARIAELEKREAALAAVGQKHGWNGVENSKLLWAFFDELITDLKHDLDVLKASEAWCKRRLGMLMGGTIQEGWIDTSIQAVHKELTTHEEGKKAVEDAGDIKAEKKAMGRDITTLEDAIGKCEDIIACNTDPDMVDTLAGELITELRKAVKDE